MNKANNIQNKTIIFGVPLIIIGVFVFISQTSWFQISPNTLSIGITIDLLLTVPLVYFLLIKNS